MTEKLVSAGEPLEDYWPIIAGHAALRHESRLERAGEKRTRSITSLAMMQTTNRFFAQAESVTQRLSSKAPSRCFPRTIKCSKSAAGWGVYSRRWPSIFARSAAWISPAKSSGRAASASPICHKLTSPKLTAPEHCRSVPQLLISSIPSSPFITSRIKKSSAAIIHESQRVLKPGGIFRFHLFGRPEGALRIHARALHKKNHLARLQIYDRRSPQPRARRWFRSPQHGMVRSVPRRKRPLLRQNQAASHLDHSPQAPRLVTPRRFCSLSEFTPRSLRPLR